MTKEVKRNQGQNKVQVPLRINPETVEENGYSKKDISYVKIGYKKYPCILTWVSEEEYQAYMRMEWADVKAEERSNRCLIPNGKGGFIMCPECNKCCDCKKMQDFEFDNNHTVSLDALNEELDYEPESAYLDELNVEIIKEILENLIEDLDKINPKYGPIFREMYNGNIKPLHIAKALDLPKSSVYDDVPKVRKLAQELYKKYQ